MHYFHWYLAIGVIALLSFFVGNLLFGKKGAVSFQELFGSGDAHPSLSYRFFEQIVLLTLALLLEVALWPIWLALKIRLWWKPPELTLATQREFAVVRADLLEPICHQDVEQRERVNDPLSVVPNRSFDHRYEDWQSFCNCIEPDDALWTFSAYWKPPRGAQELRAGYVIVRGDRIGPYFLTVQKRLNEEAHRY